MELFRTICADEAGGGPLSPAMAKRRGQTLRLTGQVIEATNPGQPAYPEGMYPGEAEIKLMPTPTVGNVQGGNATRSGARSNEKLLPGLAVELAEQSVTRADVDWGKYEPAVRRWETITGLPAPFPTIPDGKNGKHRLAAAFAEWMMGLDPGHVTSPDIGITRNQQLKAIGNGVVPRQARAALGAMLDNPLSAHLPPAPKRVWGIPPGWDQLTIYDALTDVTA